jgi:hypothetical protein
LRFERVDATLCELIAGIIGKSFGAQAELLGIDRERYPNFVAFETGLRVPR